MQDLFFNQQLSRNIYVKKSQLVERITKIRDIQQNQKFTNEILYSFSTLKDNLRHYKNKLNHVEQEIRNMEQNVILFGN